MGLSNKQSESCVKLVQEITAETNRLAPDLYEYLEALQLIKGELEINIKAAEGDIENLEGENND